MHPITLTSGETLNAAAGNVTCEKQNVTKSETTDAVVLLPVGEIILRIPFHFQSCCLGIVKLSVRVRQSD